MLGGESYEDVLVELSPRVGTAVNEAVTLAGRLVAERIAMFGALIERRTAANARFFAIEADRIARLCHSMAQRFARGGRLIAMGYSPAALSDARHIAVESCIR